jgi:AraC-like DNA-binding protein
MERTSSSNWLKGVASMFASQGIDVPQLFRSAGMDTALLDDPDARFGADQVSALWELAVSASGNATLGLLRDLPGQHANFDIVGHAMLTCPDLRTGLRQLAHHMALVSDAATFELVPDHPDNHRSNGCWLVLGHMGNRRPVPRQRQEYGLLTLLTLARWVTRRSVPALAAEFTFPDPVDAQPYQQAFECPVRFNQPATRLLLAHADLDARLPSYNASLHALHEHVIGERLSSLGTTSTSHRVREEILHCLGQGEPRREDIAARLSLSDRTLQRRLALENTSFQQLLEDQRRDLACKYLADARYGLGEVADLLGFVDQGNLFRACKRWFGLSPSQYRQQLDKPAAGDNDTA